MTMVSDELDAGVTVLVITISVCPAGSAGAGLITE